MDNPIIRCNFGKVKTPPDYRILKLTEHEQIQKNKKRKGSYIPHPPFRIHRTEFFRNGHIFPSPARDYGRTAGRDVETA